MTSHQTNKLLYDHDCRCLHLHTVFKALNYPVVLVFNVMNHHNNTWISLSFQVNDPAACLHAVRLIIVTGGLTECTLVWIRQLDFWRVGNGCCKVKDKSVIFKTESIICSSNYMLVSNLCFQKIRWSHEDIGRVFIKNDRGFQIMMKRNNCV